MVIGQRFNIPEFEEIWIFTGEGRFEKYGEQGEIYYNFDVENKKNNKISHYHKDEFEINLVNETIIPL